jgi:hypothetical protein
MSTKDYSRSIPAKGYYIDVVLRETVGLPKNLLAATLHLEIKLTLVGCRFVYPYGRSQGHMPTNGAKFKFNNTIYITKLICLLNMVLTNSVDWVIE